MDYELEEENYRVKILRVPESGIVSEERWETSEGALHRVGGPALVTRDPQTGHINSSHFFKRDLHHSDGGNPAYLEFDPETGACIYKAYFVDGHYQRPNDLPHVEWIDPKTGMVYRAEYKTDRTSWNGPKRHRENGPALILYDPVTGAKIREEFYLLGRKQPSPTRECTLPSPG